MSSPVLAAWAIRTPAGDAAATMSALRAGTARPGELGGDLLDSLHALARPLAAGADLLIVATTKADLPRWCEDLLGAGVGTGGPAWLARELGARLTLPAYALSAACASGTAALAEAGRLIRGGFRQRILVLGGERLAPFVHDGFAALRAVATAGCKPFDQARTGLILGEALAAVLVRGGGPGIPLSGWAQTCDAVHATAPCREGSGLARACARALAGQRPAWIRAHGTGTRFNDASEAAAYRQIAPGVPVVGWKGGLGHSLGACGLVEAALVAELLSQGGMVPGTIGLDSVDAELVLPVLTPGGHALPPGPVLNANAGFGGLNAAIVLGGTPAPARAQPEVELVAAARIDARGWQRLITAPASGTWAESDAASDQGLPLLRASEVLGKPDASWGRLDGSSRCLVAACRLLAAPPETGLLVLTERGSATRDREYERQRRSSHADPQLFAGTLPSTALGEASIRCGLHGPGQVLLGADARMQNESRNALLGEATDLIEAGIHETPEACCIALHWRRRDPA